MGSPGLNFYSTEKANEARQAATISASRGFEYWRCPDCRHCLELNLDAASNRCDHPGTPSGAVIDGVEWDEGGDFCLDFEPAARGNP